jgi:squalene cyclase
MDDASRKAVAKTLEWLAGKQNANGSWSDSRYQQNTAITSFALMAFLSQGHLPNRGLYSPEVSKGCRFLMAAQRDDGYLIGAAGGNMYCHGMATLALSQLYGMSGDVEVKPVLKKAIDLIVRCQSREGGWRYNPEPSGADISVTIMQVMALRSAKSSGIHVPDETLKRAVDYINKCYEPRSGGFRYQPGSGSPGFARTAAGVCVLQLTGGYDAKEIPRSIEYMKNNLDQKQHYWYGHYYACHAMHQVGGRDWETYYSKMRNLLLQTQGADGSWSKPYEVGPVYHSAIAVIILSVPENYLPIFQR